MKKRSMIVESFAGMNSTETAKGVESDDAKKMSGDQTSDGINRAKAESLDTIFFSHRSELK